MTPHTPPAALDVAAIRDLMSADEARSLLAAMTPGTLEVAEIRDGRLIDAAPQELAVVIHDDARAHMKPDGTWHSVIVCRGMDGPTREGNAAALASVKRALAAVVAADVATARAHRDGVLHGLTVAREHAVAVIDGGTGLPAIDWTDVTVATGDALAASKVPA